MIIGITGSFGSGKSTVARALAKMIRAKVIDADDIAKDTLKKKEVINRIVKIFPEATVNGKVNRKKLASIVFHDRSKLKLLEGIVHPVVAKEIRSKAKGNAVLDVPLLIESKLYLMCDVILVVRCSEEKRIERLVMKGFSRHEVEARTRMQMPIKRKLGYADYVIDNSGSLKETRKQVKLLLSELRLHS